MGDPKDTGGGAEAERRRAFFYAVPLGITASHIINLLFLLGDGADFRVAWGGFLGSLLIAILGCMVYVRLSRSPNFVFGLIIGVQGGMPKAWNSRLDGAIRWDEFAVKTACKGVVSTTLIIGLALLVDRAIARRRGKVATPIPLPMWDADADRPLAPKGPL